MKRAMGVVAAAVALLGARTASADLCDNVKDTKTTDETGRDVDFYEQLFPDSHHHGSRRWNEIVLQCNRKRDTKGNQIGKAIAGTGDSAEKRMLRAGDLEAKVIRGHYNFFGTVFTQLKYVYVLSKKKGVWTMVIPYRPLINQLVDERIDIEVGYRRIDERTGSVGSVSRDGHAWQLYDASQIAGGKRRRGGKLALKPDASPIALTLCTRSTFFDGKEHKYDGQNDASSYKRDPENKHISLGKIQYRYKKHTFLREGCRVQENRDLYWRGPGGKIVETRARDWILDNFVRETEDFWTIPGTFKLKVLLIGRNESSIPKDALDVLTEDDYLTVRFATRFMPYQYNQMYKSNIIQFNNFSTMTSDDTYRHEVGHAFGLDDEYGGERKGEAKTNGCEHERYKSFQPLTYQMCGDEVGDDRRTIYHYLAVSRYATVQKECKRDSDCDSGEWCNQGLDFKKNQCEQKLGAGQKCGKAGSFGNDHKCRSNKCSGFPKYVCK